MKIQVIYFSGTGNTAWVVSRLGGRLTALGDEVATSSIEDPPPSGFDPASCDAMGIAFPVHASFAPSLMQDFIAGLPPAEGKPLFAVTTAAYAAGDTAWHAVQPLRAKGYRPFVMANVLVANNLRLPFISPLPIPSPEQLERKLERAGANVDGLAKRIHRQERHVEGTGLLGRLLGITQRLGAEHLEALAFQGFHADESCTGCGWCVDHCPVGNIEMTPGGLQFLNRCMLCMRCYSFCPVQAIQWTERTRDVTRYPRYPGPEGRPYPSTYTTS